MKVWRLCSWAGRERDGDETLIMQERDTHDQRGGDVEKKVMFFRHAIKV